MISPTTLRNTPFGSKSSRTALNLAICCHSAVSVTYARYSSCTAGHTYVWVEVLHGLCEHLPRVFGPVRPAGELIDERLRQVVICARSAFVLLQSDGQGSLTEWLIEPQLVADVWPETREVEHDGAFAPVRTVRGVCGHLSQEIVVRLAELDVDAEGRGFMSVLPFRHGVFDSAYPLRYVEVITISFSFHWASNSSLTRFNILLARGMGNASSSV